MNLLNRLTDAWEETKEELSLAQNKIRTKIFNSSYYERKNLENSQSILIFGMPKSYISNLFKKRY